MQHFNTERSVDTDVQLQTLRSTIRGLTEANRRQQKRLEAIEAAGLRLTHKLQQTLDVQAIIQFFCEELTRLIPCDSTSYQNTEQNLGYSHGRKGSHLCQYSLELEGQYLGNLICTRNRPFGDQDLLTIETLAASLVYPLRNGLMYLQALEMAMQDGLTGAGNRKALEKALTREQRLAERFDTEFSMLVVDIDHFKRINDVYGHSAGDEIIRRVSDEIHQQIRQSDQVFRYGGEEFVVLLNNTDVNGATYMAERIRQAIEQAETLCNAELVSVTVSIGVADFTKSEQMDNLFNRADKALYRAKENGRNQTQVAA